MTLAGKCLILPTAQWPKPSWTLRGQLVGHFVTWFARSMVSYLTDAVPVALIKCVSNVTRRAVEKKKPRQLLTVAEQESILLRRDQELRSIPLPLNLLSDILA